MRGRVTVGSAGGTGKRYRGAGDAMGDSDGYGVLSIGEATSLVRALRRSPRLSTPRAT